MALSPPFLTTNQTAGFVPAGALDTMLNDRLSRSKFKTSFLNMGIALADLTSIGEDPDPTQSFSVNFAANGQAATEFAVFSLSKVQVMFAAYRLRERVSQAAAAVVGAKSREEVIAAITADWTPIVSKKVGKTPNDFPKLTDVFDFGAASPWAPSFKDGKTDWNGLVPYFHAAKGVIDTLAFMERMKLMIRFSHNMGAGSCVRDLGFQFMNGTLGEEGFADNGRNGILWQGGDFGYTRQPPIMGPPPWDTKPNATWVRSSAKGVASFLTLLWSNRAVDRSSSQEMREILLGRPGLGYGSFLVNHTPNRRRSFNKTGQNDTGSSISEGIIVECSSGGTLLRYAAAGLNATSEDVLKELAGIFFDCVSAQH
jgi:hypothetical protein